MDDRNNGTTVGRHRVDGAVDGLPVVAAGCGVALLAVG